MIINLKFIYNTFYFCSVEQKMTGPQAGCYSITEAHAMVAELREIQRSLTSGEQEKNDLMRSLAKLKDDLTRLQLGESSPNVSTLSLSNTDKLSTASQTDLSGEVRLFNKFWIIFTCI